jgi:hypothetical protein
MATIFVDLCNNSLIRVFEDRRRILGPRGRKWQKA